MIPSTASFLFYGLIISLIFIPNLIHIINLPMLNIMIDQLFKLSPAHDPKKYILNQISVRKNT